jgi:TRAP-type mannitol/chloroaromatic compound transport system substrate-binding protein
MRFFGLGGKAMEKLGVSTSLLPPGEVFAALEKGAVDAAEQSIPIIDRRLGFYKVVKYNYFPGWHQQSTVLELLVNKDRWNALTKSQQKVIELATHASMVWSIAYGEGAQAPIIKENAEKFSVKNMYWSDEMLAAFEKAWKEVLVEQRGKDEFFNKVWQDLDNYRTQYRAWSSLGFLPRNKAE